MTSKQRSAFQKEHEKLMHALLESRERESILHQQLRGLKESLVSSALRLHVTSRIIEEDGACIDGLKQEALEARTSSIEAEKRATMAIEIVNDLNIEINSLKKAFKDSNIGTGTGTGIFLPSEENLPTDEEVDEMMARYPSEHYYQRQRPQTGSNTQNQNNQNTQSNQNNQNYHSNSCDNYERDHGNNQNRPSTSPSSFFNDQNQNLRSSSSGGLRQSLHSRIGREKDRDNNRDKEKDRDDNYYDNDNAPSEYDFSYQDNERKRPQTSNTINTATTNGTGGGGTGAAGGVMSGNTRTWTPFQQWKIENLMWSPDTPHASESYEEVDIADSFKDFNTIQRSIRCKANKTKTLTSKQYEHQNTNMHTLPSVTGNNSSINSPMTFEIAKKHLWSASDPPPVVPTFLSKQEMQIEQNKNGNVRVQPAHMMINRPELGKGPIPPKNNDRIKSKLFQ